MVKWKDLKNGFILTKWYVNDKVCCCNATKPFTSFILTKWYVNEQYKRERVKNNDSFILTKWYVNHRGLILIGLQY